MSSEVSFHQRARAPARKIALTYVRSTVGAAAPSNDGSRLITFRLSDDSVARDGHTIRTAGWDLTAYKLNPIVLFSHDTSQPPVARSVDIGPKQGALYATADFAPPETSAFADSVFRLLKGGFLNACSVSWQPLEWRYATGKDRAPGSIDFLQQELLEWSIVPVPAAPDALVTARRQGIDTRYLRQWAERILDTDAKVAVPRAEIEALRRAAQTPIGPTSARAQRAAKARQIRARVEAEAAAHVAAQRSTTVHMTQSERAAYAQERKRKHDANMAAIARGENHDR